MSYVQKLTDAQLVALWNDIDNRRVKSGRNKGCVTVKAARLGDEILAEQRRRSRFVVEQDLIAHGAFATLVEARAKADEIADRRFVAKRRQTVIVDRETYEVVASY